MAYTIVVGFDGSDHARKALGSAIAWARIVPDGEIIVACSQERHGPAVGFRGLDIGAEQYWDELEKRVNAELDEAARLVREAGVKVATVCTPDRADVTIVNVAREAGAALIVVGTKGAGYREGQRSVLGSTTTKVLHEAAGIPVLVI
jgi:nucleotide-binding universal stress UspA family protein